MSKVDKEPAHHVEKKLAPSEPMPATGCVVCGQYTGTFIDVTANARVHEACAAERPDVVSRVKARG